ncbi:glycosyltransferase [Xenophilus aerolatus]
MSTYQGERYVRQQLESILAQLPQAGRIIVRDDGSHDRTADEVAAVEDHRVTLHRGSNLGFGPSFLTLLMLVPPHTDMVMFSDQDDVWLPGKIERAWLHLRNLRDRAALYASAQMLADADLRPLHPTPPWPRPPTLANALMENIVTGCTAAINRPAIDLLQQAGVPAGVHFHDWWMYLVLSAFGTVVYDDKPTLLYRQHSGNVIGHGAGWIGRQLRMASFLLRHDWIGILLGQVQALLRCYEESLPTSTRDVVLAQFGIENRGVTPRWRVIFSIRRSRQKVVHELPLRLLLTLHKLGVRRQSGRTL